MALQLFCSLEPLSTLQAPDFVRLGLLVAPAACVFFVLLKVSLTEKLSQTCHTVNALGLALVLVVELGQAEVAAASHAGVGQQAEVREGVSQESGLFGESLWAVCTLEKGEASPLPMACQGIFGVKFLATFFTRKFKLLLGSSSVCRGLRLPFVHLHVRLAVQQGGEDALAQVTLVKPVLEVGRRQVCVELFLRRKAHPTNPAYQVIHLFPSMCAQVSPVVAYLAEALPTFGTAVWACASVQVHVVLELELRG